MGRNPFGKKSPSGETGPLPVFAAPEVTPLELGGMGIPVGMGIRDHIENIPTANFQPKKRPDKRQRDPVLFVRNLDDLRERLERTSEKLEVPRDMLVRYLLERGLERHATGADPLQPVLSQRLTLYPRDTTARKRKPRKGQTAKGIGFRGIPEATRLAIPKLAEELSVPIWQVIRRLLEKGLDAWEQSAITIQVYAVQTPESTLYPDE